MKIDTKWENFHGVQVITENLEQQSKTLWAMESLKNDVPTTETWLFYQNGRKQHELWRKTKNTNLSAEKAFSQFASTTWANSGASRQKKNFSGKLTY